MLEILYSRELAAIGMDRQLRSWFARGIVTRLVPGAYVRTAELAAIDRDERYRLRAVALSHLYPGQQFSHDSAAALWRLPTLGAWAPKIHVTSASTDGGRSTTLFVRHGFGLDPRATVIDGVRVSSLSRTLAEASTQPRFARAIAMLDDGLRTPEHGDFRFGTRAPTRAEVIRELEDLGRVPGFVRGARAVEFADGASGSVGESLSRVQMRAIGVDPPQLQVAFFDADGHIADTDFYWPELGVAGEFDGDSKYGDARRFGRHLTAQEVLVAEKRREDRLRRVVRGVVRWDWATALDRRALESRLAEHGIVARTRRRTV